MAGIPAFTAAHDLQPFLQLNSQTLKMAGIPVFAATAAAAATHDLLSLDVEDYAVDVMEFKDDQNHFDGQDAPEMHELNGENNHLDREDASEEPPMMVDPISSYRPVAPRGSRKRALKRSVVTEKSKLSFTYDATTGTVTRFRLGFGDEVIAPAGDELKLKHPALLKGWVVEHRRRVGTDDHEDKYYTHPQRRGHELKSLKKVEAILRRENFKDVSVTFRNAVRAVRRPRGVKRRRTPEEVAMRKAYVERYLKDAWEKLMNRPRPADSSLTVETGHEEMASDAWDNLMNMPRPVETGDDQEMPSDASRPPGYYGVEARYQPFSLS